MTGHNAECDCPPCMVEDMNRHLASIGFEGAGGTVTAQEMSADYSVRTRYATPGTRTGRGIVRKVSDAQVKYMLFLFKSRDTSGLVRLPGSENIESMSLRGARDLISRLLACPELESAKSVRLATESQLNYIDGLINGRQVPEGSREWFDAKRSEITFDSARSMIERLKALPFVAREVIKSEIADGRYAIENENGELRFYVLRTAKSSGRQYVNVMHSDNDSWVKGAAAKAILAKIAIDPKAAMIRYGQEIGSCGHCGRTLTDAASREAGIGPICANKL